MYENRQRRNERLQREAEVVGKQLRPGLSVVEAQQTVARYPELSLRLVDADNPIVTAGFRAGRIYVYVRNGVLVLPPPPPDPDRIAVENSTG